MSTEFKECAICAAKSGSPVLCESCVANRGVDYKYQKLVDALTVLRKKWLLQADSAYNRASSSVGTEQDASRYELLARVADELKRAME